MVGVTASAALSHPSWARLPFLTLNWEEGTLDLLVAWGGDSCFRVAKCVARCVTW